MCWLGFYLFIYLIGFRLEELIYYFWRDFLEFSFGKKKTIPFFGKFSSFFGIIFRIVGRVSFFGTPFGRIFFGDFFFKVFYFLSIIIVYFFKILKSFSFEILFLGRFLFLEFFFFVFLFWKSFFFWNFFFFKILWKSFFFWNSC